MGKEFTLAHKLFFVSFGIALVSLFFKWVDIGFFGSANGLQSWTIILPLLLVYPVIVAYKNENLPKNIGIILAVVGFVLGVIAIMRNQINAFGQSANLSGSGPYVYLFAIILFTVAIFLQPKEEQMNTNKEEEIEKES